MDISDEQMFELYGRSQVMVEVLTRENAQLRAALVEQQAVEAAKEPQETPND